MAKNQRVKFSESEIKVVFGKCGNQCAFPGCPSQLIIGDENDQKALGEMAHIIAYSDSGPRCDPSLPSCERNKAKNIILLCPTHHATVDKFEFQYNVNVLREMKRLHEERVKEAMQPTQKGLTLLVDDPLFSSALPVSRYPKFVVQADTRYHREDIREILEKIRQNLKGEKRNLPFEIREKKFCTFWDLRREDCPFAGVFERDSICALPVAANIDNSEFRNIFVSLLNRALGDTLMRQGVRLDKNRRRFYFLPDRERTERSASYASAGGKKATRAVVHRPVTKATGLGKNYWVHLAAGLSFQKVSNDAWVLTVRPERHLTKDGNEPYSREKVGAKVTRIKSTIFNWQYFQEIQFWREFISSGEPRKVISFGSQSLVIENRLLEGRIRWPGVPDDEKEFVAKAHEETLFSLAELDEAGTMEEFSQPSDDDLGGVE